MNMVIDDIPTCWSYSCFMSCKHFTKQCCDLLCINYWVLLSERSNGWATTNVKMANVNNNWILMNFSWHSATAILSWNNEERTVLECWIENTSNLMIEESNCFVACVTNIFCKLAVMCKDSWASNDVYIKLWLKL